MKLNELFNLDFDEHAAVLSATRETLAAPYEALIKVCVKSIQDGGKIMFFCFSILSPMNWVH